MLVTRQPALPLAALVECLWHHEPAGTILSGPREHVLPDVCFQIVFNLDAGHAGISGVRSQHVIIHPARLPCMMGVRFRPAGTRAFVGTSALDFLDRSIPLDLVSGLRTARLTERLRDEASPQKRLSLLETLLTDHLRTVGEEDTTIHPAVSHALHTFTTAPDVRTIADVSRDSGWSRRWLTHAFSEQVGITPKRYCRILRFQKVLNQIAASRQVDWIDVALSCGFCDQAHLIHEFRAFSGLSPERYLTNEHPFPNHVQIT